MKIDESSDCNKTTSRSSNFQNKKPSFKCLKCSKLKLEPKHSQLISAPKIIQQKTLFTESERVKYVNLVSWYQCVRQEENWRNVRQKIEDKQAQFYIDWINKKLEEKIHESYCEKLFVKNLYSDLNDGLVIIYLIEILYNVILIKEKLNSRLHKIKNFQTCMNYMETERKVECVGISPMELADGNRKILLGFLFLIKHDYEYNYNKKKLKEKKINLSQESATPLKVKTNDIIDESKFVNKLVDERESTSIQEKPKSLSNSISNFLTFENSYGYQLGESLLRKKSSSNEAINSEKIRSRNLTKGDQEYELINNLVRKSSQIDELYNLHVKKRLSGSLEKNSDSQMNSESAEAINFNDNKSQNYEVENDDDVFKSSYSSISSNSKSFTSSIDTALIDQSENEHSTNSVEKHRQLIHDSLQPKHDSYLEIEDYNECVPIQEEINKSSEMLHEKNVINEIKSLRNSTSNESSLSNVSIDDYIESLNETNKENDLQNSYLEKNQQEETILINENLKNSILFEQDDNMPIESYDYYHSNSSEISETSEEIHLEDSSQNAILNDSVLNKQEENEVEIIEETVDDFSLNKEDLIELYDTAQKAEVKFVDFNNHLLIQLQKDNINEIKKEYALPIHTLSQSSEQFVSDIDYKSIQEVELSFSELSNLDKEQNKGLVDELKQVKAEEERKSYDQFFCQETANEQEQFIENEVEEKPDKQLYQEVVNESKETIDKDDKIQTDEFFSSNNNELDDKLDNLFNIKIRNNDQSEDKQELNIEIEPNQIQENLSFQSNDLDQTNDIDFEQLHEQPVLENNLPERSNQSEHSINDAKNLSNDEPINDEFKTTSEEVLKTDNCESDKLIETKKESEVKITSFNINDINTILKQNSDYVQEAIDSQNNTIIESETLNKLINENKIIQTIENQVNDNFSKDSYSYVVSRGKPSKNKKKKVLNQVKQVKIEDLKENNQETKQNTNIPKKNINTDSVESKPSVNLNKSIDTNNFYLNSKKENIKQAILEDKTKTETDIEVNHVAKKKEKKLIEKKNSDKNENIENQHIESKLNSNGDLYSRKNSNTTNNNKNKKNKSFIQSKENNQKENILINKNEKNGSIMPLLQTKEKKIQRPVKRGFVIRIFYSSLIFLIFLFIFLWKINERNFNLNDFLDLINRKF